MEVCALNVTLIECWLWQHELVSSGCCRTLAGSGRPTAAGCSLPVLCHWRLGVPAGTAAPPDDGAGRGGRHVSSPTLGCRSHGNVLMVLMVSLPLVSGLHLAVLHNQHDALRSLTQVVSLLPGEEVLNTRNHLYQVPDRYWTRLQEPNHDATAV